MHAAARLDFRPTLHNNFFTNTTVAPLAISLIPPALSFDKNGTINYDKHYMSILYQIATGTFANFTADTKPIVALPLDGSQNSIVQVPYLCHFSVRKSTGPLVISVLVATLSMFSAGWGVSMLVASYFAKRNMPESEPNPFNYVVRWLTI